MGIKVTVGFRLIGMAKDGEGGTCHPGLPALSDSPFLKSTEVQQRSLGSASRVTRA